MGQRILLKLTIGCIVGMGSAFCSDFTNAPQPNVTNTTPVELADMNFEQLAGLKVDTVYGASKHEQKETEAPSSVSIVTADDIQKSGYRTLSEILNGVRGFYTTSDQGFSYIGTRGFNRPGDYGGRLLIMVDGHRLNDAIDDQALEYILDVDLIDRVEVIRGPGSSLYGNNAFLGVINVITRKGRDFDGVEASGSYASYDTYTGRISFGNRFKNGVEMALSGTYINSEGNNHEYFPEFSQANHGYADNSDGSYAGSAFASISYGDFSLEGGFVQRKQVLPTAAYGAVFDDSREDMLSERAFTELKFHHEFEQEWEVTSRLYYDHYYYEGNYPLPLYPYGDPLYPGPITLNRDVGDQESLGSEVQVSKTLFESHRLTVGTEFRHDFSLEMRNFDIDPPATYLAANPSADTVGVYLQDEYSILDSLILNAGARYDYFSSFGYTVNPRTAIMYTPWTNSTFKLIYGQAFRAPNAFEIYYEAPGYSSNPSLKPETIRSYELVYEQVITPHLQLVSSVFDYEIKDLISFGEDANGSAVFGNLSSAASRGAEVELDANWAEGWTARTSYTFTDARDGTGQRLSNSPENLAKFNLTAPLWGKRIFANFEILAMSNRLNAEPPNEPETSVAGHCVANVTLLSREIVKGLEISASIYNVWDQRYSDPVSTDFMQNSIPREGRSFRVKVTYRF